MKRFISLSKYPSSNGKYFYTNFFKLYNIEADYVPLPATDENFEDQIRTAIEDLRVSGISVSMPFKNQASLMLDYSDSSVSNYNSCNTIVIKDKKLYGYNTDLEGVIQTCTKIQSKSVAILGDGSMANMYSKYLSDGNVTINMYSRRLQNWDKRHDDAEVVINCTGIGTGDDESPMIGLKNTKLVIDLAIKKKKLYKQCLTNGVEYISGSVFYKHQFLKQFMLYTGVSVNELEFDEIEAEKNDY
jgi:shikimate dehydrogenase